MLYKNFISFHVLQILAVLQLYHCEH